MAELTLPNADLTITPVDEMQKRIMSLLIFYSSLRDDLQFSKLDQTFVFQKLFNSLYAEVKEMFERTEINMK